MTETVIYRDESGAALNWTAAFDAIKARSKPDDKIVLSWERPPERVRPWAADLERALGAPLTGSDLVEFVLYRRGEEIGRAQAMQREQVETVLRDLLERFDLLVPPCPVCEVTDNVETQTPEDGRPYSCNDCGLEFFGPDVTLPSADTSV